MASQNRVMNNDEDFLEDILIICPKCKTNKELKIPRKVVDLSKQLTTISIPSGLCCEHSFQSFVDKNFKIRGYQNVDFEFKHIEYYESNETVLEEKDSVEGETQDFSSLPVFQNIIQLLRNCNSISSSTTTEKQDIKLRRIKL